MYYIRMYARVHFFLYLLIYADMCACTRIRRASVIGKRIFRHFELLLTKLAYVLVSTAHTHLNFS